MVFEIIAILLLARHQLVGKIVAAYDRFEATEPPARPWQGKDRR